MLIEFLLLIIVAGICGAIGQAIAGHERVGCLISILSGFIGAYTGTWIYERFELPEIHNVLVAGISFPIVWSIVFSILFVIMVAVFSTLRR